MAKNKTPVAQAIEQPVVVAEPTAQATNHTLVYRRNHPGNRCSYGVPGVPGIVVFDLSLFADGKPPSTITLDCKLALPATKSAKPAVAVAPVATT